MKKLKQERNLFAQEEEDLFEVVKTPTKILLIFKKIVREAKQDDDRRLEIGEVWNCLSQQEGNEMEIIKSKIRNNFFEFLKFENKSPKLF